MTPAAASETLCVVREKTDPQLTLQPLHLLAQRRLHDVLPGGRAGEVQLLGQGHEVLQLP
jgi:hypothetical protein